MIEKYSDYIENLPLTKVVKDRIEEILKLNLMISNFDIIDIFICELKNDEGSRNYTSLWLFTDEYCIECKDFLTSNNFDITPFKKKITYCSIEPYNFDFVNADVNSVVKLHFTMGLVSGNIISTEQNCKYAFEIYKKYVVPNLIE